MAFENLKGVLRSSADPFSALKLTLAAGMTSRRRLRPFALPLLEALSTDGRFWASYRQNGAVLKASFRLADLSSDLLSFYELVLYDCYRIPSGFEPKIIVDGGGNTGLFTLAALTRWPQARVVVFEPVPDNAALVESHLRENSLRAEVHRACLGLQSATMKFYCRDANRGSFSPDDAYKSVIDVPVTTLSKALDAMGEGPALVKLDIEGAEVDVLSEFLTIPRPDCLVVGELHHWPERKPPLLEVLKKAGWVAEFFAEDSVCVLFHAWDGRKARPTVALA